MLSGAKKPFAVCYENPEHNVKLLKGDCAAVLNQARENSVDAIFADPPYFLSNGGISCHAGKMVSVNKGKWDKSRGVEENHRFNWTMSSPSSDEKRFGKHPTQKPVELLKRIILASTRKGICCLILFAGARPPVLPLFR